jgi:hypothetical protein
MSRFLLVTWNGAGNQPPAAAIAQALKKRGHDITFAGYENQRGYFAERGFSFVLLERSSATWRDESPECMFAIKLHGAWASFDHIHDIQQLISSERYDALVVDCLMFGALAAAEKGQLATATLVHLAPGALMPPNGRFETLVLGVVNEVRMRAGLSAINNLWEAWARFPALSNSVRELDPLAVQAPKSLSYLGPMAEDIQPSCWNFPGRETIAARSCSLVFRPGRIGIKLPASAKRSMRYQTPIFGFSLRQARSKSIHAPYLAIR